MKDKIPNLVVDEILDELHRAQYFTKLDLWFGYHQVWMATSDVEKLLSAPTSTMGILSFSLCLSALKMPHQHFRHWWMNYFNLNFASSFWFLFMIYWSIVRHGLNILTILHFSFNYCDLIIYFLKNQNVFVVSAKLHMLAMSSILHVSLLMPPKLMPSQNGHFLNLSQLFTRISRLDWLLLEIHSRLWPNCCTSYTIVEKGQFSKDDEDQMAFTKLKEALVQTHVLQLQTFKIGSLWKGDEIC